MCVTVKQESSRRKLINQTASSVTNLSQSSDGVCFLLVCKNGVCDVRDGQPH